MNDNLEVIWKEVVVAKSRYYPGIVLEGLLKTMKKKNSVRTADVTVEIRNEHLPKKS
ncbi:hypothetical protein B7P43_G00786 [Cryptotermes secundus]|uniref:Uncharacterized protein n=1 Tax=Cryptotermes secundus TaxID=105785 RepID=A0A2J7QSL0_9NEOP|nr:hypothetical protein B7P43_G00786 [Cryptotermes secundus]